jgi:hypothetical protein
MRVDHNRIIRMRPAVIIKQRFIRDEFLDVYRILVPAGVLSKIQ